MCSLVEEHAVYFEYGGRRPSKTLISMYELVEALWYKLEGCGFGFRWCHRSFSLT